MVFITWKPAAHMSVILSFICLKDCCVICMERSSSDTSRKSRSTIFYSNTAINRARGEREKKSNFPGQLQALVINLNRNIIWKKQSYSFSQRSVWHEVQKNNLFFFSNVYWILSYFKTCNLGAEAKWLIQVMRSLNGHKY